MSLVLVLVKLPINTLTEEILAEGRIMNLLWEVFDNKVTFGYVLVYHNHLLCTYDSIIHDSTSLYQQSNLTLSLMVTFYIKFKYSSLQCRPVSVQQY